MNCPIKVKTLNLDGTWQEISINREFVAVGIQARGDNTLLVSRPGASSLYWTIKAGTTLDLSSGNFTREDVLVVKGTNGDVCEMIGFIRE